MDLLKAIHELELERQRIESSIQHLEQVLELGYLRRGRGRRYMPEAERQMVSHRMKEYWANRRRNEKGLRLEPQALANSA